MSLTITHKDFTHLANWSVSRTIMPVWFDYFEESSYTDLPAKIGNKTPVQRDVG